MSPTLNGSSAIQRYEGSDVIEICNGIAFNFYTGLPHILKNYRIARKFCGVKFSRFSRILVQLLL